MGQLGFLVIGNDPDVAERHDRNDLRPVMHILSGAHATLADQAVDRRGDARIAELDFGEVGSSPLDLGCRAQLAFLGVEHRHLPLRGSKRGLAVRQVRLEPSLLGNCLLDLLRGAEGAGQQGFLTNRLLAGALDIGLGRVDRILRLSDLVRSALRTLISIAASAPARSASACASRAP